LEGAADVPQKGLRVSLEHLVGRAMNVIASSDEIDVGLVVVLKGQPIAVMAPTIGFHDHLLRRPKEVDEMTHG
jgi:hypothetical protein